MWICRVDPRGEADDVQGVYCQGAHVERSGLDSATISSLGVLNRKLESCVGLYSYLITVCVNHSCRSSVEFGIVVRISILAIAGLLEGIIEYQDRRL